MAYDTQNPLGSTDPRDLFDNAHNFDIALNDLDNDTFKDRLGRPRKTYSSFERDAKSALELLDWQAPVAYQAGLLIEHPTTTVSYGTPPIVYRPEPSLLPFTTSEWDRNQWHVVQNTSDTNLVYQFNSAAEAQTAAPTLPEGSTIFIAKGEGGSVVGGNYVADRPAWSESAEFLDYAAIRAYSGFAQSASISADGIAGRVYRRGDRADNGVTVFKDAAGRSWERGNTSTVTLRMAGAVPVVASDQTDAVNRALQCGATVINGEGLEFTVRRLIPTSQSIFCNARLKRMPEPVSVSLSPVIDIAGVNGPRDGIGFIGVKIHGNRQQMADVYVGAGEDGGMHGFRIGEDASNISIIDCEANYCGTAGMALHVPDGPDATYRIKNIYVRNFRAEWNREHGMFADGFDGFEIDGAHLNSNAQDLDTTSPLISGMRAFRNGGFRFGSGFDLETYAGNPQSFFKNFKGRGIEAKRNATQCMIYVPNLVSAYLPAVPVENIQLSDVDFEYGDNGSVNKSAFWIYSNQFVAGRYGVNDVRLSGKLRGFIDANNVKGLTHTSGFIDSVGVGFKAKIENSLYWGISVPSDSPVVEVETLGNISVTKLSGAGALTAILSKKVICAAGRTAQINTDVNGGTIAGGAMAWRIDLPFTPLTAVVSMRSPSAYKVAASSVVISGNSLFLNITPVDLVISGEVFISF